MLGRRRVRHRGWLVLSTLAACSSGERQEPPTLDSTSDTWAARIDATELPASVLEVARGSDPDGAQSLRHFALSEGLRRHHPTASNGLRRVALARATADDISKAAAAAGAPNDDELRRWTEANWLNVDRPAAFQTTHAVVLTGPDVSPADEQAALALAEQIRRAVLDATTTDEFKTKAAAVPSAGLTVKVEDLEPVTNDGRVVRLRARAGEPIARYDQTFATAAATLDAVGATSPIVKSAFGFHVLRLVRVLPELRVAADERRVLAHRDIINERAKQRLGDMLRTAREEIAVEVERSSEEATARVRVE